MSRYIHTLMFIDHLPLLTQTNSHLHGRCINHIIMTLPCNLYVHSCFPKLITSFLTSSKIIVVCSLFYSTLVLCAIAFLYLFLSLTPWNSSASYILDFGSLARWLVQDSGGIFLHRQPFKSSCICRQIYPLLFFFAVIHNHKN